MCKYGKNIILYKIKLILVNNYEINEFQGTFLMIWSKNPNLSYIPLNIFLSYFEYSFQCYIRSYFVDTDKIVFEDFFNMTCFYLFSSISRIISVLITMCKIHSNLFISKVL